MGFKNARIGRAEQCQSAAGLCSSDVLDNNLVTEAETRVSLQERPSYTSCPESWSKSNIMRYWIQNRDRQMIRQLICPYGLVVSTSDG